jgi:endonuclease/exonuclease/phosphatase family metal-dependent hydrolase
MRKSGYALAPMAVAVTIVLIAGPAHAEVTTIRILDLNMSGTNRLEGRSGPIASYLFWKAAINQSNVIAAQEVCETQFTAILQALRLLNPAWSGSFRSFGTVFGCAGGARHGLAIFTEGPHTDVQTWDLPSPPHEGEKWWGLMKAHFRGVDVFNTHIRAHRRLTQTPVVVEAVEESPLAVLAGDFNATFLEPHILQLYQQWFEVDSDFERTFSNRKIDYVWATQRPILVWGDAQNSPSDHRLLRAVIILDVR